MKKLNTVFELEPNSPDNEDFFGTKTQNRELNFYTRFGKRAFDIVFVLAGLPFVLPVMLVIAIAIRLDGGSVFYSQPRLGLDGRKFRFWKFRSMVEDADERLKDYIAHNPEAAREWRVAQKLKKDPRVTRIGRFIRMSSLDELPQLWNVLTGDMSLVGPRPMMPEQRAIYPGSHYETLRPGITGFWQVSERNSVSFAERAHFDKLYAESVTLGVDLRVLLRTVKAVCRGSGY